MLAWLLSPGVVIRFHDKDPTSPPRVYGVPKKMPLEKSYISYTLFYLILLQFCVLDVPCSVTTSTLSLVRALEESVSMQSRLVLNRHTGCGKLFLLLQVAEYAASSSAWLVLHIPWACLLVDASTPSTYSLRTRPISSPAPPARPSVASAPPTPKSSASSTPPPPSNPRMATPCRREEGEPTPPRIVFPRLIAINDFQALTGRSMYRDTQGRFIRQHHLASCASCWSTRVG
ncbi:hypothetical protein B0H11DRAFT_2220223 [Mycena galericulata]|nr:hypothetical protein B0H11DRAFT_2220223 [Mycena galericulata]